MWRKVPLDIQLSSSNGSKASTIERIASKQTATGTPPERQVDDRGSEWRPFPQYLDILRGHLESMARSVNVNFEHKIRDYAGCLESLWASEGGRKGMSEGTRKLLGLDADDESVYSEEERAAVEDGSVMEESTLR